MPEHGRRGNKDVLYAVGLVSGTLNTIRHRVAGYRTPRGFSSSDVERAADYDIRVVDAWIWWSSLDFAGKRVLEIGPGPDLGTGAVALSKGADSYLAIDRFDLATKASPALYERLGERLGEPVERERLGFITTDFPRLRDVEGPFDVIVSNATLEHVDDIWGTFARLGELAAPGCVMCHYVDAKTHMRWIKDRDPLNILRYRESLYSSLLSFPGAPNRLLASDYAKAAGAAGFSATIVPVELAEPAYVASLRGSAAPQFRARSDSDLSLLAFTLVGRS